METILSLRRMIKRRQREFRSSPERFKQVLGWLNQELADQELAGQVVSVLVHDGHGKINCYGQWLEPGVIWRELNLSIGQQGTRLTGIVAYRKIGRLTSYRQGYFVPGQRFDLDNAGSWVALVNISVDDESAKKYPRRPLR